MKRAFTFLLVAFVSIYIGSLGVRALTAPDETRYGEIPREMLASGDWTVPHLNGLKYFEKPPLGYWVNALSILWFGETAFALRLPSALSVLISALMIFLLARRFLRRGLTPVLAPTVFLTFPLVLAIGHIALLDSLFSMLLTGAMVSFFFAHMAQTGARKSLFLLLTGLFCGLAFLTKGFLAFAVPVLAVVPFLLWERRFKDMLRIPWIPMATAFLVVLPWSLMIHSREGDFWNYFFFTEHIARFLDPVGGQHPKPFWYFLPILLGGALPWAVQGPAALPGVLRLKVKNSLVRFALCWFLFPFLFFSACSGKLIAYLLPCFPPLAILFAIGLADYFQTGKRKAFVVSAWVLAGIAALGGAVLLFSRLLTNEEIQIYETHEWGKWLVVSLTAFSWAFMAISSTRMKDYRKTLGVYSTAALIFFFTVSFAVPDKVIDCRAPGRLLELHLSRVTPEAIMVSNDNVVRAVCWFFKRNDVKILEPVGELAYGLEHDPGKEERFLTLDGLKQLIRENAGKRPVILVLITEHYQSYADQLPPPAFLDTDTNFVFAEFF